MAKANIYSLGGTVQASKGTYLSRLADEKLLELCQLGEFIYILTSRQMGKSSLMISTASKLKKVSVKSVIIDLTKIGTQVTVEQWYLGLLLEIEEQLMLETDVEEWWQANDNVGFTQRLTNFFQHVLLEEVTSPVVVFVDEIDTTLSLNFTDDFFAAIRYLYVARAQDDKLARLSFVLIGVATPGDLIRDSKRTPFNIGQRVDLTDFSFEEAMPLAEGLRLAPEPAQELLKWVLEWTGGHPYLTQRLCSIISEQDKDSWSSTDVKLLVGSTFFGVMSKQDNNLQFVRDMLTKRAPNHDQVLSVYRQIRLGRRSVFDEEQSIIKSHLKLSGVVRREDNVLQLRNRIYGQVFDRKWINENLPFSLRDRWEQLKPALPYIVGSLIISLAAISGTIYVNKQRITAQIALEDAKKQKNIAEEQRHQAKIQAKNALQQQQRAEQQTKEVEKQKHRANEERKRAQIGEQQAKSAQKTAEERGKDLAAALQKTESAKQAEATQRQVAEDRKTQAEKAQQLAQKQEAEAKKQQIFAQKQERAAKTATAEAQKGQANAEILAETRNAENRLSLNLDIEALVAGLKAGKQVKKLNQDVEADNRIRVVTTLQQVVYGVRERNRLEGHSGTVYSVAFSPDGKMMVSISGDRTVKLWNFDLDDLMAQACAWIGDYLKNNHYVSKEDKSLCDGVRAIKN
ncbi:MAG: AAA-like domain-containing protein [Rhizonema sp. PD38]|nr:AAA-like domain-containing protein [Rhizonema sp. PD38]